ncbi:MAG: hypothetical protein P8100_07060 [bacterium]|jgi:hypothetical protein
MDDKPREPLEEQIDKIIRKKSDENLALQNLIKGLEKAEKKKTLRELNGPDKKINKES